MNCRTGSASVLILLSSVVATLMMGKIAAGQTLSGEALIKALRQGGYVIVMRHASSPQAAPDRKSANPDNVNLERQLDEAGRASATAMGKAARSKDSDW